jgi:hypothetical protein
MRFVTRAVLAGALAAALLLVAACTEPTMYTQAWLKPLDVDTKYQLTEQTGGFQLIISHEHYQYREEQDAILADCERTFTSAAQILATRRGHNIGPQSIQSLEMSTGRNIFSGTSTCNANALVTYTR